MKIVVVCGAPYVSGKEKIMLSMLSGFKELGHEVSCITSNWNDGDFKKLLTQEGISYKEFRLGFISQTLSRSAIKMTIHQLIWYPSLIWNASVLFKSYKPDIVIHSNFHHLLLMFPVLNRKKIRHVYHSHESISKKTSYKKLFLKFNKKIHCFVGVSNFVSNRMVDLGLPREKVTTIQNGLKQLHFVKNVGRTENPVFNIGIVGQVGEWKGHTDLIQAVSLLLKQSNVPLFKVYIYGTAASDEYLSFIKTYIVENDLSEIVSLKGYEKDLNEIYGHLDLVCIPSRSEEPFATSALEPGLFALPVIVTNRGGLPEIVEHGYNGFIVESSDPAQLAYYLLKLLCDRKLAKEMGLHHQLVIQQKFSFQLFIKKWASVLEEEPVHLL